MIHKFYTETATSKIFQITFPYIFIKLDYIL